MRQVPRAIRSGGDVVDASPTPGPQALMHVDKQVLEFYEDRWCQVDGEPFTVPLNQRSSVAIMVDVRPLFFSATNDDQFWGGDIVGIGATYPTMSMELNLFVNGSLIGPRSLEEINNFEVPGLIQTHGPRLNLMTVTTVDGEITITPRLLMHGGGDEVVRSVSDPPRFRERAWSDNYEWESQYISILLIDEDYWYVLVPFRGVSESVVTAYRYPRRSVYDGFLFSPDCPVDPYPGNPNHAAHLGQVALSSWDFCWEWDSSHRNRFPTDSGWDSLDYLRDWIVISGDRLVYITMGSLNDPLYGEYGLAVWSANYKTADLNTGIDNPHNFDLIYSIANEYFARCLWEDPDQVSNPGGVYVCYSDVPDLGGSSEVITITRLDVGGNVLSSSTHGPIPKADFGDGDSVPLNRHRGFEKDKTGVWFFFSTHNQQEYCVLVRYDFASDSCSWLVIAGRVMAEGNPIETRNPYSVWVQVRAGTPSKTYWKEVQYVNGSLAVTQTIAAEYASYGNTFFNAHEGVRYHSPTAPEDHAYVVFTEESAAALVTTELIVGVNTEDDCTALELEFLCVEFENLDLMDGYDAAAIYSINGTYTKVFRAAKSSLGQPWGIGGSGVTVRAFNLNINSNIITYDQIVMDITFPSPPIYPFSAGVCDGTADKIVVLAGREASPGNEVVDVWIGNQDGTGDPAVAYTVSPMSEHPYDGVSLAQLPGENEVYGLGRDSTGSAAVLRAYGVASSRTVSTIPLSGSNNEVDGSVYFVSSDEFWGTYVTEGQQHWLFYHNVATQQTTKYMFHNGTDPYGGSNTFLNSWNGWFVHPETGDLMMLCLGSLGYYWSSFRHMSGTIQRNECSVGLKNFTGLGEDGSDVENARVMCVVGQPDVVVWNGSA